MTVGGKKSHVRMFGPDHKWQLVSARGLETRELFKYLREEMQAGNDLTIVIEPWGEGDPFNFPYPGPDLTVTPAMVAATLRWIKQWWPDWEDRPIEEWGEAIDALLADLFATLEEAVTP